MKSKKINGPHIKDSDTTSKIMTRLLIALAPIVCFALFKNSFMAYFYSEISVFKLQRGWKSYIKILRKSRRIQFTGNAISAG